MSAPLHTVHFDLDDETVTIRLVCHGDETSQCHQAALADATREAWTVLGPPTKGDH